MRLRLSTLYIGVTRGLCSLSAAAQAQIKPFRGSWGQGLSPEDNQLLFESIARLNTAEPGKVGRSDGWSNPRTHSSGTSTVLRVFHSGGMACHLLRHTSSSPDGRRLAMTASPGVARRPGNGRARADRLR